MYRKTNMYIKIVRNNKEKLYECWSSEFKPIDENNALLEIFLFGGGSTFEHIEYKDKIRIFYMNDQGKTVDSKIWED